MLFHVKKDHIKVQLQNSIGHAGICEKILYHHGFQLRLTRTDSLIRKIPYLFDTVRH